MSALTDAINLALVEARATEAQLQSSIAQVQGLATDVSTLTQELQAAQARIVELENMVPPPAGPSGLRYLSDLTPTGTPINGWGPYERDRANGEQAAGDGPPLRLRGTTYAKGLGVHARSVLTYTLGGFCNRFRAVIGIDDSIAVNSNPPAAVTFRVLADDAVIYTSAELNRSSPAVQVDLPVVGVQALRLEVLPGATAGWDHANWADAHLSFATQNMLTQFALFQAGRRGPLVTPATIGTVSVIGAGRFTAGQTVTLTASRSGGATDIAWSWSVPAGSGVTNSNQATLSFTASATTAGTYTVTATSATASDSPRTAQAAVTFGSVELVPLTIVGWSLTPADIGLAGAGVDRSELTVYNGPFRIPAGTTLDQYRFTGSVNVNAGNIVISRSLFEPLTRCDLPLVEAMFRDTWTPPTLSHTVFNCEFSGEAMDTQRNRAFLSAWFGPGVFQRNYVHHMGGGLACYNAGTLVDLLVENNYVDDVQGFGDPATTGNHSSCMTFRDFTRAVRADRSGIVRRNYFNDTSPNASGSFTIYGQQGVTDGLQISENLFAGNNWNVIIDANNPHPVRNLTFTNNRFDPSVSSFGPFVNQGATNVILTNNNRLNRANAEERGAAVP